MSRYNSWKEWEEAAGITPPPKERKGRTRFNPIDPARHREIARMGGRARHQNGTGHEFREDNPDAARAAQRASAAARVRNSRAARLQHREADSGGHNSATGATEEQCRTRGR